MTASFSPLRPTETEVSREFSKKNRRVFLPIHILDMTLGGLRHHLELPLVALLGSQWQIPSVVFVASSIVT